MILTVEIPLPCSFIGCTNEARYITSLGEFACGKCPVEHKVDAIKIASVPELLGLVRAYLDTEAPVHQPTALARSSAPAPRDRPQMWAKAFFAIVGKDSSLP